MAANDAPTHDRPWRRPGALRYALNRVQRMIRPPVEVFSPAPGSVVVHHDVAVTTRDGTVLRVNVYLAPDDGEYPVVLCAHPYGKDNHPKKRKRFPGHSIPFQYRALRQPAAVRFSALTGWER